jgi:anti-sigma regulatory factor (Ser/Thr protein kinase)
MNHLEYQVCRDDYGNAGKISSQIKKYLKELGIPPITLRKIAVASYEAEINMIIHAYGGKIYLDIHDNLVKLEFNDVGPGIENVEKAMVKGYSTADDRARKMGFGAGMGLYNIERLSDSFKITSSKKGTVINLAFKLL